MRLASARYEYRRLRLITRAAVCAATPISTFAVRQTPIVSSPHSNRGPALESRRLSVGYLLHARPELPRPNGGSAPAEQRPRPPDLLADSVCLHRGQLDDSPTRGRLPTQLAVRLDINTGDRV